MLKNKYFSETITGNLKVYSINWLEKYLKDYDLLDSYKEEHPRVSASTSVGERINNKIQHNIKYINLVNNKLKK